MSTVFSKPDNKRQSIYSFIRHKLIKGDVRKYKTDPNSPSLKFDEHEAFDEKPPILTEKLPVGPPDMVYEEEEEEGDDSSLSSGDEVECLVEESDPHTITMQKLTGTFSPQKARNTAALITLSPCALAAANAARQKRQKNVHRF